MIKLNKKTYKYIYEKLINKGIWHLCHDCTKCFGSCKANPIFMSNLHEVPPPKNDSIIFCDKFKANIIRYSTGDTIYCHDFEDCCGCFYFKKSNPNKLRCNECGKKYTLEKLKQLTK